MEQNEKICVENGTNFRTAFLWHIPTLLSAGSLPEAFYDAAYDEDLDDIFPFLDNSCFYNIDDDGEGEKLERYEAEERIIDKMMCNMGQLKRFIAKIECPVFTRSTHGFSYSWGYFTSKYVLVNDIDELILAGEALEAEMKKEMNDG